MQNNIFPLIQVELRRLTGWNVLKYEKNTKKRHQLIAMAIIMPMVAIMMGGYCFAFSYGFGYLGMAAIIPGYGLMLTSLVTLIFTFLKTNGILFGTKDYDMLMALPFRIENIITAKFLSMYLNNLLFCAIVMLPMGAGYAIWEEIHGLTVVMWILCVFFAPLLPMTIASIVGAIIMFIGSGAKNKVVVQISLTVLLIVGIFGGSFWAQQQAMEDEAKFLETLANIGQNLSDQLHHVYPPSAWFDMAIQKNNILYFLLFVIVSLGIYQLFVWMCAKVYRKTNTALTSHHAASKYQITEMKTSGTITAIARKEAKRFFSSVNYLMNVGMGLILALIAAIASIFLGLDSILTMMGVPEQVQIVERMSYAMPFAIAMIVNMSSTTAVSLSLEGKNLWIVQSLPISFRTLLKGKMLFNMLLVLPVSLICSIIFMIQMKASIVLCILYIFTSVVTVSFSTVFGMLINVKFPNFDWENEITVIKQGMASMLAIFGGMVEYMILAVLAFVIGMVIPGELGVLAIDVILGGTAYLLYRKL